MGNDSKTVKSADIARRLNVSRATVHKALRSFNGGSCIIKERYSAVALTDEGERIAGECLDRYRQLERCLEPVMGDTGDFRRDLCSLVKTMLEE